MSTDSPLPALPYRSAPARLTLRPKQAGSAAIALFLAANATLIAVFFGHTGALADPTVSVGRLLGLGGGLFMDVQLLLAARIPWLERRLGMDELTSWHRLIGFGLAFTVLGHLTFVTIGLARAAGRTPLAELLWIIPPSNYTGVLLGVVATVLILLAATVSTRRLRRRLSYEKWHLLHLSMYLAAYVAFAHATIAGDTFIGSPAATTYWSALLWSSIAAILTFRVGLPVLRNLRHRLRVSEVVSEADDVVSVRVTGRRLDLLPAAAGQFFVWRFLAKGRWWKGNPFSVSESPDGRSLRLTAKAVGQGSSTLRDLQVGTRVIVEGPYGALTALHRTTTRAVLVAGGIGITPILSLLAEIGQGAVVIYRARTQHDVVLRDELTEWARRNGAVIHLLVGPSTAPGMRLDAERLRALVPDLLERDVYVCGPRTLTDAVFSATRELGVPRHQVHAERFAFAD
ncbi:ferredoxin reductase family protein [Kutzneria sp. NPDC051319]|uniref:ferredoxin reductase family protein n=1 Tax=Kutzneria sp. NPDC051319 TaxID=3155047 RepID=UPI0034329D92